MLGLSGAQRTGKTTLAGEFAKAQDLPFVKTATSEVFRFAGVDPKAELPIDARIAIREVVLHTLERQYAHATKQSKVWIADRTPLDMAAYMLADVRRSTVADQPGTAALVVDYVRRCILATNRWFSTVVLVQPGIPLHDEQGKAQACPAFMEHMNTLIMGLLMDERLECAHYFIPRRYVEMDDRVRSLNNAVMHALEIHRHRIYEGTKHGMAVH